MTEVRCPFLREADAAFAAATERFEALVENLTEDQANWRPDPRSWSVAACIDHLVQASETYFVRLVPALERARRRGRTGAAPYGRGTLVGRLLLGVLDPDRPQFRAVGAPKVFRPRTGRLDAAAVGGEFRAVQVRWHEVLRLADGLDLGRVKFATPVSPLLRVTATQAVRIHVWHEPRHLAQAERIVAHPDFPRD